MTCHFHKIWTSLAVVFITFLLGVVSSAIVSRQQETRMFTKMSPIEVRSEQWHRLYEAAGMTGDGEIIAEVRDRLLCTNRQGESVGVKIDIEANSWCRLDNGDIKELAQSTDFGAFSDQILKSHFEWSLRNLDFLKSVDSGQKARQYVKQHRCPQ